MLVNAAVRCLMYWSSLAVILSIVGLWLMLSSVGDEICVASCLGSFHTYGMQWKLRDKIYDLENRAMVMAILNVTPDSFSDGGQHVDVDRSVERALEMVEEGADIIDIGGESTRPGAEPVTEAEEIKRTVPVIEAIRAKSEVLISIDTSKAEVARQALLAGADIVNDVTGLLGDRAMVEVCAQADCAVVVMHMQGNPKMMQDEPKYDDVVGQVREFFEERYASLTGAGIAAERICFDPGIGFGKTLEHNKTLIRELGQLVVEGRPLLLGVSRKSMIGAILDEPDPQKRDWGTVALTAIGWKLGAQVHRVHEVKMNADALRMVEAILVVS